MTRARINTGLIALALIFLPALAVAQDARLEAARKEGKVVWYTSTPIEQALPPGARVTKAALPDAAYLWASLTKAAAEADLVVFVCSREHERILEGIANIPRAPTGIYWDGGIIDYHLHLPYHQAKGLVLYPHFTDRIVPGWLDKAMPWRRASPTWQRAPSPAPRASRTSRRISAAPARTIASGLISTRSAS